MFVLYFCVRARTQKSFPSFDTLLRVILCNVTQNKRLHFLRPSNFLQNYGQSPRNCFKNTQHALLWETNQISFPSFGRVMFSRVHNNMISYCFSFSSQTSMGIPKVKFHRTFTTPVMKPRGTFVKDLSRNAQCHRPMPWESGDANSAHCIRTPKQFLWFTFSNQITKMKFRQSAC